jgi:hypothetical protein
MGMGGEGMTLEEALTRIEFLQKALDGAIDLAKIERVSFYGKPLDVLCTSHYYESCNFTDEPELGKYIMSREKK